MLQEGHYSDDLEVNKQMYNIFKAKFAASAIRSDERDIKTVEFVNKKKQIIIPPRDQYKGRGRYLAEVAPPQKGYEKY